ncbi:hypothetical protein YTPLAS18_30760 [Nitrospira sp.]|nr:hypothetical protein YTPLAS18_30760 [Nitrospira sp.]
MTTIHDLSWWYWLVTAVLLAAGLFPWPAGLALAMALCAIQIVHVSWLTQDVTAFPAQVRIAYLVLLFAGSWEPLHWIHWMQLAGTTARVAVGYCLLARTLSLAPWNRTQALTIDLVKRTFLSLQTTVHPCGAVFRRMALERVHE